MQFNGTLESISSQLFEEFKECKGSVEFNQGIYRRTRKIICPTDYEQFLSDYHNNIYAYSPFDVFLAEKPLLRYYCFETRENRHYILSLNITKKPSIIPSLKYYSVCFLLSFKAFPMLSHLSLDLNTFKKLKDEESKTPTEFSLELK